MRTSAARSPRVSIGHELALAGWVGLGLAGALWITDDLDLVRLYLLGYAGVPWAVLHFGLFLFRPRWPLRLPRLHRLSTAACLLVFGFGILPFVNAISARGHLVKRTVLVDRHVAVRDTRVGGLGMLYRTRW